LLPGASSSGWPPSCTARDIGEISPEAPDPGDSLAFTALGRVLSRIPLREREVLVLYYVADLPVEQIARDRGIPAGTVKSRLAAGRRRLERGLAQDRAAQEEARDA
jgi:RNA polymerase sigma-70 factor (ECF subfamily)